MATSIGANGDRHWQPLAPFKWRHLIHSMAILTIQSEWIIWGSNGANRSSGTIDDNCDNGDVNFNVNVISRAALIRNRVSRRVCT